MWVLVIGDQRGMGLTAGLRSLAREGYLGMEIVYTNRNRRLSESRANEIGHALAGLVAAGKALTPPTVVEAARNPASPLHGLFEWDDGRAAAQYRLEQARRIIKTIVVKDTGAPLFLSVVCLADAPRSHDDDDGSEDEREYVATAVILQEPDRRLNAKVSLLRRLRAMCIEVHLYDELLPLAHLIQRECEAAEAQHDAAGLCVRERPGATHIPTTIRAHEPTIRTVACTIERSAVTMKGGCV